MNNQYNCQNPSGVRGQQSTGSLNQNQNGQPAYTPYMFGSSYGPGINRGSSVSRGVASTESVRACMHWPLSLESKKGEAQGPSMSWSGAGNGSGAVPFNFYNGQSPKPRQQQQQEQEPTLNYPQPTAFIQMQGQGGKGEMMQPLSIPCQMGPLGTDPNRMIQPVEPLTIKVIAPARPAGGNPGGSFTPMTFQVGQQHFQR